MQYTRKCPECGKNLTYKNKNSLATANSAKSICRQCSDKKITRTPHNKLKKEEVEVRIKEICTQREYYFIGFKNNEYKGCRKTRLILKCLIDGNIWEVGYDNFTNKQSGCTECNRLNISKRSKGKKHTLSARKKMSESGKGKVLSKETRMKMSISRKGLKRSDDTKRKMRIATINRIEKNNGQCFPNYNPIACDLFDKMIEETGYNIQHAKNGGEYHIKELGYFVDGYDPINNIVYEYDERRHFDLDGELIERDKIRQKEIEDYLGCKFIRIKEE